MAVDDVRIFGGTGSPKLTKAICDCLGVSPGEGEVLRFPEGNLFVRILENVRGRNVYIVQSTAFPANDHFMELVFWIDAFKRASAASVTAVVPYFSYAKGDKKDEPRVSIRARVCADTIEAAGADRVVTMDLHAPQIQGFFKIPVDDLYALPVLCDAAERLGAGDAVVVSPDPGFIKKARQYAHRLGAPLAIADKQRLNLTGEMVINDIIGTVDGRAALIVDDFTVSGGTLVKVAARLVERGATDVLAVVTHGVFTQECMTRLDGSPIRRLLVTDTIETQPVKLSAKVEVVSIAPLFAEAVRRIHDRQSISVLFND
ncbi:MAG TPA: ribose-phosphate diphosphokinase [Phycisphaerae bacterium]|nr:ribose-phosphate diphosphokinase [Phycisphaerae bacterium]